MIWPHQIALNFASSAQRGIPLFPPPSPLVFCSSCSVFPWEQCKMSMEGSGCGYLLLTFSLLP